MVWVSPSSLTAWNRRRNSGPYSIPVVSKDRAFSTARLFRLKRQWRSSLTNTSRVRRLHVTLSTANIILGMGLSLFLGNYGGLAPVPTAFTRQRQRLPSYGSIETARRHHYGLPADDTARALPI